MAQLRYSESGMTFHDDKNQIKEMKYMIIKRIKYIHKNVFGRDKSPGKADFCVGH